MIEKLTVLSETRGRTLAGSTFSDSVVIGANPIVEQVDNDDNFGDIGMVGEFVRVRIDRTPTTEEQVLVSTRVRWRGEQWHVRGRRESRYRGHYDLTLERTAS